MKTSHVKFISPDGRTIAYAHFGYSDRQLSDRAKEIAMSEGCDFIEINRFDASDETAIVWYVS